MLERLILTLQRADLDEIVILSQGSIGDIRDKTEENMTNDPRFKAEITWHEQAENKDQEIWQKIESLIGSQNFLLMNGNMVATATTIQDFIEQSSQEGVFEQEEIVGLEGLQIKLGNIFLSPSSKLEALKNYIKNPNTQTLGNVISLESPKHFAKLV
jgi:NDP-sugar pyrophosphorylase family protein